MSNRCYSVYEDRIESEREFYNIRILKYRETIKEALNIIRKLQQDGCFYSWEQQQIKELYELLKECK